MILNFTTISDEPWSIRPPDFVPTGNKIFYINKVLKS